MGEAAKLFTRSLMMGLDSAVRKPEFAEPTAEDIENMLYHEAVEFLKKRDVIKKVDYDKLSDKMKFRAFTASRINDGKLLERLNAEMLANVNGGKGLKDFLSLTKTDILDKIGMGPNQGWYWETVYRTNVQTAYNVGRAMGFEVDKPLALQFVGIDDARQTDVCHSLSGIVRPYGDPFWQSHFPPLHFNCRSTIRAIYDEAELPEEWSVLDEAESPAKGFGSYPLDSDNWWKELDSQVRQAKALGVQGEIEAAYDILIREMANGQRRSVFEPLSDSDKKFIYSEAEAIGIPKDIIVFREGHVTGYLDSRDKIYISSSVFPSGDGSLHNRDNLSVRAVLAHEYYGHRRYRNTPLKQGSWQDEFRASYSAAINAPNLSAKDRQMLMRDALDRASEVGVKIKITETIRRFLYGH
ncbi:MAG: minor capsid protein [Treponema sp.]|nr:minor capsid protein [Treponema sp.]MBQ7619843.1 minor capsid protein [Treponema sp.]MBQ9627546.1 minor capsid protein [Treponema sp.]